MIKRLLAFVVAIAMVGGAFAFRSSREDAGRAVDGGSTGEVAGGIYCAAELGPVCSAVPGAIVEPATVTADRIVKARSASDAEVRAWVTAGPWADIVDAARAGKPQLFAASRPLASTTLVSVTRKGAPPAGCAAPVTWKCIGDAAQQPSFRLAGDPPSDVGHLFIRAAALGGFLATTDYAINDLDEVAGAATWLDNVDGSLDRAPSFGAGSLGAFLATRGATAQAFLTTDAAVKAAGNLPDFEAAPPNPPAVVGAFVAVATGARAELDEARIREALTAAGWKAAAPPGDDGLPSPGVLVALRGRLG